jgi:hypothetical protein
MLISLFITLCCYLLAGLTAFSLLPMVFEQKSVFYKQFKASFFPAPCFVLAQSLVLFPLLILEGNSNPDRVCLLLAVIMIPYLLPGQYTCMGWVGMG